MEITFGPFGTAAHMQGFIEFLQRYGELPPAFDRPPAYENAACWITYELKDFKYPGDRQVEKSELRAVELAYKYGLKVQKENPA
jgi:hypothetical protein